MEEKGCVVQKNGGKLFNFRPVFFAALYLIFGVVFCFYCRFYGLSFAWLACLPILAAIPVFLSVSTAKRKKCVLALLSLCVCFFAGFFGFSIQVKRYEKTTDFGECYFTGKVVEIHESYNKVGVVLDGVKIDGEKQNCKLIAYLPTAFGETITLSDELFLRGEIEKRDINAENFTMQSKEFGKRIFLVANDAEGEKIGHTFDLFLFLNARAKTVINAGMDEMPAAVTRAVLLGDTDGIESGLYENIRRGGIAHIFAVSGLHVGSLFAFCLLLLKKTPMKGLHGGLQFLFVAFILLTYAGVCAFSPSVVRATVICLIAYGGKRLQVKTDFLQSLGGAAICILIFNPSALFTVGFQLSFAACLGIAFLTKPIGQVFDECAKLYRKAVPVKLTEAEMQALQNDDTMPPRISTRIYRACSSFLATSLGAQIFTAPILLHYFGYVSGWALLLNCIFVPFIGVIFSLLLLSVAVACVLPVGLSTVILYVPNVVWSAVLLLFEAVDFTSFALEGLTITTGLSFVYLTATLFFTDKWDMKKSLRFLLAGVCIFAFVAGMYALNA